MVSIAVMKHHDQRENWGRKGFIRFILPDYSPLVEEIITGTQSQNLKTGTDAEVMEGCFLLACFS